MMEVDENLGGQCTNIDSVRLFSKYNNCVRIYLVYSERQ